MHSKKYQVSFLFSSGNCCLGSLKNEDSRTLVGGKKQDFLVPEVEAKADRSGLGEIAIIGRKNSALFERVVELVCQGNHFGKFAGGIDTYKFQ